VKLLITFTLFIVTIFGLNSFIINASAPSLGSNISKNMMTERFHRHITIPVNVIVTDDLRSGGIGNLTSEIRGYVNMFDSDNILYVEPIKSVEVDAKKTYLLSHEYAHIGQKELIAESALGYPSHWNPIQSASYYQKLIELDNALSVYYAEKDIKYSLNTLIPHLEQSADCLTQAWGSFPRKDSYVGEDFCTIEQKAAALVIADGEWPTYEAVHNRISQGNIENFEVFEEIAETVTNTTE
jgi:hypothetical protein